MTKRGIWRSARAIRRRVRERRSTRARSERAALESGDRPSASPRSSAEDRSQAARRSAARTRLITTRASSDPPSSTSTMCIPRGCTSAPNSPMGCHPHFAATRPPLGPRSTPFRRCGPVQSRDGLGRFDTADGCVVTEGSQPSAGSAIGTADRMRVSESCERARHTNGQAPCSCHRGRRAVMDCCRRAPTCSSVAACIRPPARSIASSPRSSARPRAPVNREAAGPSSATPKRCPGLRRRTPTAPVATAGEATSPRRDRGRCGSSRQYVRRV